MPFNLRGGRPKNMKQGIFWVQRHLSNQKRTAVQRNQEIKENLRREFIDEKLNRIRNNVVKYAMSISSEKSEKSASISFLIDEKKAETINKNLDEFNALLEFIDGNKYTIKLTAYNKLSTLGRSVIKSLASAKGQKYEYQKDTKYVKVNGLIFDFS